MGSTRALELDRWFQDTATGQTFRIIAVDRSADSIEVQYQNGDLAEFDFASWQESAFAPIEAPEDWSLPFDDVEIDDMGYSDSDRHEPDLRDLTLDDFLDERGD
jgi:hypothetical protein